MLGVLQRCVVVLLATCTPGCDASDAKPGPPPLPTLREAHAQEPVLAAPAPPPPTSDKRARPGRSPAAAPAPKHAVTVPRTPHVWAEIPSGLQADLDADPRMQAWLDAALATLDKCHAASRSAVGVVEGVLTMHANDRPDLSLTSMPAAISMVVACATGPLTRNRMPLFTGKEGRQYVVRLHFE